MLEDTKEGKASGNRCKLFRLIPADQSMQKSTEKGTIYENSMYVDWTGLKTLPLTLAVSN